MFLERTNHIDHIFFAVHQICFAWHCTVSSGDLFMLLLGHQFYLPSEFLVLPEDGAENLFLFTLQKAQYAARNDFIFSKKRKI